MSFVIRLMKREDKTTVFDMMKVFYNSPAVLSNGSDEIYNNDIENCVNDCPFLEGYIFEEDGNILGYAMTAKSFSTEFGKPCIWIEDLYIKPEYRGKGIGSSFFKYIEEENENAIHVYRKNGYEVLPYMELKKEL